MNKRRLRLFSFFFEIDDIDVDDDKNFIIDHDRHQNKLIADEDKRRY